jgi:PAS domain S-box-containing protein
MRMKIDVYASFRHRTALIKARERQLRESEEVLRAGRKLASVLEGLPVGVIIADVDGRIGQMNEEALRILKPKTGNASDAYAEVLAWWEHNESRIKHADSPLARALEQGDHTKNEIVSLVCIDGTVKNVIESTSPLRSVEGAIVGAVMVMQDMTETKKCEADFENRITRLVSLGVELERASHP